MVVWAAVECFPPRHDLGLLLDLVPVGATVKDLNVRGLSVYAVEQRCADGTAETVKPEVATKVMSNNRAGRFRSFGTDIFSLKRK